MVRGNCNQCRCREYHYGGPWLCVCGHRYNKHKDLEPATMVEDIAQTLLWQQYLNNLVKKVQNNVTVDNHFSKI